MPDTSLGLCVKTFSMYGDRAGHGVGQGQRDLSIETSGLPDFEIVLKLFHKRIYNLVYRLFGNADESADIVQETFVKAFRAYSGFRGDESAVYPWLCKIAVNGCRNKFSEMGRRRKHEAMSLDAELETEDSSFTVGVADDTYDPSIILQNRELESKILDSIDALSPEFREMIVLRDMQGLSYKDIADVTGLSVEVVKARLFRARAWLRRRLQAYLEG
ncbi:MAG TPA: sigma-70 family RNA polymerase sigma factor [Armatimonadota bacterium]|jgi:RNA polymerase sigma-70 factor (ECF subfamily)